MQYTQEQYTQENDQQTIRVEDLGTGFECTGAHMRPNSPHAVIAVDVPVHPVAPGQRSRIDSNHTPGAKGGAGGEGYGCTVLTLTSFTPQNERGDDAGSVEVNRMVTILPECATTTSASAGISLLIGCPEVPQALVEPASK